jgi:transposase-like protein
MDSMGKKPRRRRSFTPEFKAEIVELCQRGDRSVGQVSKDFDLTETAVREWVKQAERDTGTRLDGGLTTACASPDARHSGRAAPAATAVGQIREGQQDQECARLGSFSVELAGHIGPGVITRLRS